MENLAGSSAPMSLSPCQIKTKVLPQSLLRERWARLKPLVERAVDLEGDELERFLARAGQAGREVARIAQQVSWAVNEASPDRSSDPLYDLLAPTNLLCAWRSSLAGSRIGTWIGPYEIKSVLGTGGMGTVYLAELNSAGITRRAAVKIMDFGTIAGVRERFTRECEILAALSHPNIPGFQNCGVTSADDSYLAMDVADGMDVDTFCRVNQLPNDARIGLIRQIADVLSYVHSCGVLHLDIKPSNIWVGRDGKVKLLDFGIAKWLQDLSNESAQEIKREPLTHEYAAPEQEAGKRLTVQTDIFQLGKLAYQLLGEQEMFDSSSEIGDCRIAAGKQRGARWQSSISGTFSELPQGLGWVLRKATENDPAERYATMDEFTAELGAFLKHDHATSRRAAHAYPARNNERSFRNALSFA